MKSRIALIGACYVLYMGEVVTVSKPRTAPNPLFKSKLFYEKYFAHFINLIRMLIFSCFMKNGFETPNEAKIFLCNVRILYSVYRINVDKYIFIHIQSETQIQHCERFFQQPFSSFLKQLSSPNNRWILRTRGKLNFGF